MVNINWTKEAQIWMKEIFEYISYNNPDAAEKTVMGIYKKAVILEKHPRIGHRHHTEDESDEVRVLLYGHYRITYRIVSEGQIDILGVFHGALDIDRFKFE